MKNLCKRIYDLIIKLVSVKGAFAILFTVLCFVRNTPTWMAFAAWGLLILGREWFKRYVKGNTSESKDDSTPESKGYGA